MVCNNCGTQLPEGSKFCTACGTPVEVATPVAEVPAAAPAVEAPAAPVAEAPAQPIYAQPAPAGEMPAQPMYARPAPAGEMPAQPMYAQPAPAGEIPAQPMYAQPGYAQMPVQPEPPKKKRLFWIPIVAGAVVLTIIISILAFAIPAANEEKEKELLQERLLYDWSRVESEDSLFYTLVLDFGYGTITYDFESAYYDSNLYNYTYEIVSGDEIKVNGTIHTIEFNDDVTMMTITPALTSTDSSENWFNLD